MCRQLAMVYLRVIITPKSQKTKTTVNKNRGNNAKYFRGIGLPWSRLSRSLPSPQE